MGLEPVLRRRPTATAVVSAVIGACVTLFIPRQTLAVAAIFRP